MKPNEEVTQVIGILRELWLDSTGLLTLISTMPSECEADMFFSVTPAGIGSRLKNVPYDRSIRV